MGDFGDFPDYARPTEPVTFETKNTPGDGVRNVNSQAGMDKYNLPMGAPITDAAVPRQAAPEPTDLDGRTPDAKRVAMARKNTDNLLRRVQAIDEDTWEDETREIYNIADIDLGDDYGSYTEPQDYDEAALAQAVANSWPWKSWNPCRAIRKAGYALLGFSDDDRSRSDPHISETGSSFGGGSPAPDLADPKTRMVYDLHAYLLLTGIRDGDQVPDLYRGVDLRGQGLPEHITEGATLEMPIASWADGRNTVSQYGTDLTFHMRYAKAVRGNSFGATDDKAWADDLDLDDDDAVHEYVSGGKLRVVKVEKLTQPAVPDYPSMPDDEDEAAWEAYYEQQEAVSEFYDDDGELRPEHQPWENERYLVFLEQVETYDPDATGVQTKGAKMTGKPIPDYDWLFADPMRDPEPAEQPGGDLFSDAGTTVEAKALPGVQPRQPEPAQDPQQSAREQMLHVFLANLSQAYPGTRVRLERDLETGDVVLHEVVVSRKYAHLRLFQRVMARLEDYAAAEGVQLVKKEVLAEEQQAERWAKEEAGRAQLVANKPQQEELPGLHQDG